MSRQGFLSIMAAWLLSIPFPGVAAEQPSSPPPSLKYNANYSITQNNDHNENLNKKSQKFQQLACTTNLDTCSSDSDCCSGHCNEVSGIYVCTASK